MLAYVYYTRDASTLGGVYIEIGGGGGQTKKRGNAARYRGGRDRDGECRNECVLYILIMYIYSVTLIQSGHKWPR